MNPLAHHPGNTLYLCRPRPGSRRVAVVHVPAADALKAEAAPGSFPVPRIRTLASYASRYAATIDLEAAGFRSNGVEHTSYGEVWMRPRSQEARHA